MEEDNFLDQELLKELGLSEKDAEDILTEADEFIDKEVNNTKKLSLKDYIKICVLGSVDYKKNSIFGKPEVNIRGIKYILTEFSKYFQKELNNGKRMSKKNEPSLEDLFLAVRNNSILTLEKENLDSYLFEQPEGVYLNSDAIKGRLIGSLLNLFFEKMRNKYGKEEMRNQNIFLYNSWLIAKFMEEKDSDFCSKHNLKLRNSTFSYFTKKAEGYYKST